MTASDVSRFDLDDDAISLKLSRIRAIMGAGLEVIHVIHRHDIPDAAVLEVEAALIDAFPGISNAQGGYGSGSRGPLSVVELIDKYALPTIDQEPIDKLVLININKLEDPTNREAVHEQTRLAWRINMSRAGAADYVLSVVRGVVVGVFVADKWLPATHANFPEHVSINKESPERAGFRGRPAPEAVWEKYVGERGKRIAIEGMQHVRNPVRYWKV